jgi:regulator of protease activity HflC (stomatin/prohibitin superfamily)
MLLYSVAKDNEETIKNAAFSFNSPAEFQLAMQKLVEGEVRAFVATKNQDEILGIRQEMASNIKEHIDIKIEVWGYALHDIQITDLQFDKEITDSMAKVVSSFNLRKAA